VDIDLTVLIQFGIFLVLLVVLNTFVFRPFLALRKERSENIEGARTKAGQLDAEADEKIAGYEEQIVTARKDAASVRAKFREEGEQTAADVLAEAHGKSDAKLETARQKMAKSIESAQSALRSQANDVAKAIAHKLLDREV